jgi:hypothetical protein
MTIEQRRYFAYMLRLWQVDSNGEPIWRASLESPHTGERVGFASLEDLFDFLRERTGVSPGSDEDEGEAEQ